MNPEKLKQLQAQVRIGGKGTPRRKMKKVAKVTQTDDKKLQATLKKLNVQSIPGVEEVNMFQKDGSVIHFKSPQVHASVSANTFAVYGKAQVKELSELVPGILSQIGPDSFESIRKMAEAFQQQQGNAQAQEDDDDEDDVPELVDQDFEEAAEK